MPLHWKTISDTERTDPMKLTEFVLAGCPYCRQAREVLDELYAERPEFAAIEIDVIDESVESALSVTG